MDTRSVSVVAVCLLVLLSSLGMVSQPVVAQDVVPNTTGQEDATDKEYQHLISFNLRVTDVTICGPTCAIATGTIQNTGDGEVHDVVGTVEVFADETRVWTGTQELGTIHSDETHTVTEEVRVSLRNLIRLKRAETITIRATVVTAEGTYTENRVFQR